MPDTPGSEHVSGTAIGMAMAVFRIHSAPSVGGMVAGTMLCTADVMQRGVKEMVLLPARGVNEIALLSAGQANGARIPTSESDNSSTNLPTKLFPAF